MSLLTSNPKAAPASRHLIVVLLATLCVILPLYWFDDAQTLRPTRVLGPVGLQSSGQSQSPVDGELEKNAALAVSTGPVRQPAELKEVKPAVKATTPASGPATHPAMVSARPGQPLTTPDSSDGQPRANPSAQSTVPARAGPVNLRQIPLLPIEGVEHLKPFYRALARNDRTAPVRVLHYGDSTLAGDGISKTVRARLKTQFGDGGPGFFVAGMDPRWMRRDDVQVTREGQWDVYTILHGGNQGRYGLGGIVAKPRSAGQVRVSPARSGQSLGQRLEIYTQKVLKPEALRVQINGQAVTAQRIEHASLDQWVVDHERDIVAADVKVGEAGLELYGLVLESKAGLTWETTAVVGVSNGSFRQFNPIHLAEQTRARKPDLIVVTLGGNDAGSGGIFSGEGKVYRDGFTRVLQLLRQGAPQAACLIMSPLDQGTLGDDGRIYSKPAMARIVELQRRVSQEQGCAFWDTWSFMGGQNAFARWLEQGLAWTDLMHLTERGLNRIGQGLSNALIQGYEQHRSGP